MTATLSFLSLFYYSNCRD